MSAAAGGGQASVACHSAALLPACAMCSVHHPAPLPVHPATAHCTGTRGLHARPPAAPAPAAAAGCPVCCPDPAARSGCAQTTAAGRRLWPQACGCRRRPQTPPSCRPGRAVGRAQTHPCSRRCPAAQSRCGGRQGTRAAVQRTAMHVLAGQAAAAASIALEIRTSTQRALAAPLHRRSRRSTKPRHPAALPCPALDAPPAPAPQLLLARRHRATVLGAAGQRRHAAVDERKHGLRHGSVLCVAVPQLPVLAPPKAQHQAAAGRACRGARKQGARKGWAVWRQLGDGSKATPKQMACRQC